MRLKVVDPEYDVPLTIETAGEPVKFSAVFRRVGRKEQKRLLKLINGWGGYGAPEEEMQEQEDFVLDQLIRFEGLEFEEDEGDDGQVSGEVKALIRSVVARRVGGPEKTEEIEAGVEELLINPAAVRRFQEIAAILDDPLYFHKVLQAGIRSIVEAGVERSKN